MGLRIPLLRRPDPVIEGDELDEAVAILEEELQRIKTEMAARLVSESVIRRRLYVESILEKMRMGQRR